MEFKKKPILEPTEWIPVRKRKQEKSYSKQNDEYEEIQIEDPEYDEIQIEDQEDSKDENEKEIFGPKRKMDKIIPSKEKMKQCEKKVVGGVMHRYKKGELHSGKTENIVQNKRQAIAIALSMAKKQCKLGKK
jgi:hypothetical protein